MRAEAEREAQSDDDRRRDRVSHHIADYGTGERGNRAYRQRTKPVVHAAGDVDAERGGSGSGGDKQRHDAIGSQAEPAVANKCGEVHNAISEGAVHGPVIQSRDCSGPITLGEDPRRGSPP